jgi:NAD(P)H-dependent FMN reductase
MRTLLGLSGSLRAGSYNTALLRAAAGLMPAGGASPQGFGTILALVASL